MIHKEFLNYQNKRYSVYEKVRESHIDSNRINELKEFWMCDIVLKQKKSDDFILMFLQEIPELEILV